MKRSKRKLLQVVVMEMTMIENEIREVMDAVDMLIDELVYGTEGLYDGVVQKADSELNICRNKLYALLSAIEIERQKKALEEYEDEQDKASSGTSTAGDSEAGNPTGHHNHDAC